MGLQEEIDAKAKEIQTDGYSMSINEVVSLYRDREMDIHPEFQRFFRWTLAQKSRLIESILLGIPVPSIFVAQREDGVWDVVDGLQRLSTILEFMGELRGEDGHRSPPSILSKTRYLPSLEKKKWDPISDDDSDVLTNPQRLIIKRAKLDIRIIKRESDPSTKYELFQRLNTGGTPLTDQEVRNCLLLMVNREFYGWISELRNDANFQLAIAASDRQREEQYDLELVLRFIAYRNVAAHELTNIRDLSDFLTDSMLRFAEDNTFPRQEEERTFRDTFAILANALADETFRKFDPGRGRFIGGFSVSAFEAIAIGVAANLEDWSGIEEDRRNEDLRARIAWLWTEDEVFRARSGTGVRAGTRVPYIVPHGVEVFRP